MRPTAKTVGVVAAATSLVITAAGTSFADNVYNTLDASVDAAAEAMSLTAGGAVGTTQLKIDSTNGDGKNGCNLTGDTTLKLKLASSAPTTATVSPTEVTFTSCGDVKDLTVTGLAAGTTNVTATQQSNSSGGTFDLAPVSFTVTVAAANTTPPPPADTTAPAAPSIDLLAASDTGASDTDNITFDTTPTLTGVAEAGSTVEVLDGATLLGTTPAAATGGAWTYTPGELPSGSYSFAAKAKDAAGNISVASQALPVTIDTTTAQATINVVAASDTGSSSTDDVTSDNTPTLDGTAEAGSSVKIFDGTTLLQAVTAGSAGTWTATTGVLIDGTHLLAAQAIDIAGNVSEASLTLVVQIDTAAPSAPSIDLDAASDSGASNTDNVTNDSTPTLSGDGEAGSTVEIVDGSTALGTVTATSAGTWSYTSTALDAGSHVLTASATDASGNVSPASSPLTVTVDMTAPAQPSINLVDASDTGASKTDNITGDSTPTLDGTAEAGSTVKVFKGTTELGTATAGSDGKWTVTTGELIDGTHVLTAKATDIAGNTSAASLELTIETDTVAPTAPSIDLDEGSDSGASNSDNVTKDTTLVLNGTAEAGSTVSVLDGTFFLGTVSANSTGAWSYTTGALQAGAHTFTAKAADASGNESLASADLVVTVDTTAPTSVTFVNGPEADTRYYTSTVPAAPTCTATDDLSGLASCTVTGHSTVEGTHTLTATATDNAGNTTTATRTYTIKNLTRSGFYSPVDMNGVYNTIKGGNTVPLKFEVFDGSTELKTTAAVAATFTAAKVSCTSGSEDAIEVFTTTGQTELRFDTTSDQFIQNWKTPTGSGCYKAALTTADGQTISALFKTLK